MDQQRPASRADHYRKRADEFLNQAKEAPTVEGRRKLEEIAKLYLRIADDLEKADRR